MDKKILLSITAIAAISVDYPANAATTDDPFGLIAQNTTLSIEEAKTEAVGKCAAGKCGNGKRFEEVTTDSHQQDKLVYARDGKCGLTGHSTMPQKQGKCSSGLCGNLE